MEDDYSEKEHLAGARALFTAPITTGKRLLATDDLLRHGGILAAATVLSGGCDYAFQIFMGRALGPEQYGVFGALFAVFYLVGILGSGIRLSASRFVAELVERGGRLDSFHRSLVTRSALFGVGVCLLLVLASPFLSEFLRLSSVWPIVAVAVTIPFVFPVDANMGSFQGVQLFGLLGGYGVVQASVKLLAGVSLVLFGYGLYGAFGALVVAGATTFVLTTIHVRRRLDAPPSVASDEFDAENVYAYVPPAVLAAFCLTVPANVDVIVVQHFFTGEQAGHYTAASVLGKALIFLPMGISGALFPKVTTDHTGRGDHASARGLLHRALLYTAVAAGAGALAFWFLPTLVLDLLFGEAYVAAAPLVQWYGVAVLGFVLAVVILKFELARDRTRFVYAFTAVTGVEIALMWLFHGSMVRIIQLMLVVNAGLLVYGLVQVKR